MTEREEAEKFVIDSYVIEKKSFKELSKITGLNEVVIKKVLNENNIEFRKGTPKVRNVEFPVPINYRLPNIYVETKIKTYKAVCKKTGKEFMDYMDKGGQISKHILLTHNISKPTLDKRKSFFLQHNKYWHEQFVDIVEIDKPKTKKCKFCEWETIDLENRSGYYKIHLRKEHGIDINKYLKDFPEENGYFKKDKRKTDFEGNINNYVTCKICGKKLKTIGKTHLKEHGITRLEYIHKYSNDVIATNYLEKCINKITDVNKRDRKTNKFSKEEKEIYEFLSNNKIKFVQNNRTVLNNGKEIDFFIESHGIGIEYNGNIHHTEWFGNKNKRYHLDKTEQMNKLGYKLIHIFDDELHYRKNIIFNKLKRLLKIESSVKIIGARKCEIKEISKQEKQIFLDKYHIQGDGGGSIFLAGIYDDKIIGVMVFKKSTENGFELTRFATNYELSIPGLGSKLLKYFINTYTKDNDVIFSFADRRWTLDKDNNLYTKLGFSLIDIIPPDYRYYNPKFDKYKRFHKFGFRKQILHKKYNLSLDLTETEMVKILGFDRIWDCGLFKYELIIKK